MLACSLTTVNACSGLAEVISPMEFLRSNVSPIVQSSEEMKVDCYFSFPSSSTTLPSLMFWHLLFLVTIELLIATW